ncbi:MAG: methyltransferase [Chloroflexota bacterium]
MDTLLSTLGYKQSLVNKIRLVGCFAITTCVMLLLGHCVHIFLDKDPLLLHLASWLGWFLWQGVMFPDKREVYIKTYAKQAYKKIFFRDILLGVSFGISQMMRPVFFGILTTQYALSIPARLILATTLTALGCYLLYAGFKTIGIDGAGFLYEFCEVTRPMLNEGIYAYVRHPLFLGGVLTSVGASIAFPLSEVWWLAALNVAILPVYRQVEDSRDVRINGDKNAQYVKDVNAFVPHIVWETLEALYPLKSNRKASPPQFPAQS